MRSIFRFFTGLFIGWWVGALIVLLLTPESGEELRGEIRTRSTGFLSEIQNAVDMRRAELERQLAEMRAPRPHTPAGSPAKIE